MTLMRSRETHGRKVIFILVFLSHCALILIISRWSTTQKSAAQIPHEPLFVFFLRTIKAEGDVAKGPSPANARPVSKHPNTPAPNDLSNPTGADATPSNAIIDWYAEAHSVAEDALEKDRSKTAKRAFEHKMPTAQEREKDSIFAPAPVRRAGTWDGPDSFYVTDNCRYVYDRAPQPPPTLLDNRLKTPVCKPPPKGGGDSMFKDLTPDYLKSLPEPKKP